MKRAEQRRRTEARILAAARHLFAAVGYDRTTIRAVAAAAEVDAGLVMHYFGSKDALFAQATAETATGATGATGAAEGGATESEAGATDTAESGADAMTRPPTTAEVPPGTPAADVLLASLAERLVDEPEASLAVLRSMLTNADAAGRYRAMAEAQLSPITAAIPAPDADLRSAVLSAIVHGVIIERYLLKLGPLADADPERIIDLLRPCFHTLAATEPR
ncbi:TetR family transcriptional regulator [Actinoplanes sp. NPDC049265]|uniref:TetR/AcrR family transcriptional regulator n=1 Tax=Actinoplanes sp. NPDC049265 TaxID=3363902 RepID=UPI0037106923